MEVVLENRETGTSKKEYRKALVPTWIKVFGWIFIVMGALVPFFYLTSLFFGFSASYMMFGLEYEGPAFALMPLSISTIILINGICAYGLLFGKEWGLNACLVFGYIGLFITIATMFIGSGLVIRLEPIIQIPYLIKLHKIKAHR
ncbi:hypothetical protein [Pseudoalteromonas maricaloris]|uniref:hypothetical protein n=1 Tax=Pseudoalteromonas maricaloris TaxID=184924 RepID=UPI003C19CD3B